MTPKKRKKRRPKYGRILFSLILFFGAIYMLVQLGIDLFYKNEETYLVTVGNLNIENQYEALILRNEMVIDTNLSGQITYFANEGEVLVKDNWVAEIYNDGSSQTKLIEETEREENRKMVEFDYNLLESDINALKNEILFQMEQASYEVIPTLKQELILKLERLDKLQGENKFLSNRSASYAEKTLGEGVLLAGQKQAIYAPASGILTYRIDGYEDFLTIDNLYNINYDEIGSINFQLENLNKSIVKPKDKLFKIVDHSSYYMTAIISNEEVETYKNTQSITVRINGQTLRGDVYDVFTNQRNAVVVIQMRDVFEGFQNQRFVSCTIVRENYRGLKLHTDSIVNIEGTLGVYVVDQERKLNFVPIKILGYDDDSAIVYNAQFYDSNLGIVRSIKLNQEVVRHAINYKVGDRLD